MLLLSLGSNLGNKEQLLQAAIRALEERVGTLLKCSPFYVTSPVGFRSSHAFLNAVVAMETALDSWEILRITQEIERDLGRTLKSHDGIHYDRTIDIDLLVHGDCVITTEALILPHPRMHERRFVLQPLCDIAPQLVHPVIQKNYQTLLNMLNQGMIRQEQQATVELQEALNRLLPQLSANAAAMTLDRLSVLLKCPTTQLFTLRDEEGKVQAMTTLSFQELPTGTKAWVEDVVVDVAARGRGYARQLLKHIESVAREKGAKSLNLTSRPEREAANSLYRSLGYKLRDTNVYRLAL